MKPKLLALLLILAAAAAQDRNKDEEMLLQEIFGTPNQGSTTGRPFTSANPVTTESQGNRGVAKPDVTSPQAGQAQGNTGSGNESDEDKSCVTQDNLMGECVPYYLCDGNTTIIDDGVGIIDIRVSSTCKSYLDTCCTLPEKRPADNPIVPSPAPKEEEHQGCGWRNVDGVGFRITGDMDNEAKFGEFPWMVAILKIEPVREDDPDGQKLNVYVGGGSLIHPSVVLTAAHYVANKKLFYRVRAGEWDTQTKSEIYPYQDQSVQHVSVHKDFNSGNLFYDIAVLFLEKPLDLAPNVAVACLPPPGKLPDAGTRCFASGWGKDLFGKEGRYQVILKRVEVPVVDRNTCQKKLRQTRLGRHFMLHSSFMCAGGEKGKDTCKGDGGSPLVCPIEGEEGRFIQSGIVSWGIGCGEDGTPGVYVNVANLRNWIDNEVAGRGYDPKVYSAETVL